MLKIKVLFFLKKDKKTFSQAGIKLVGIDPPITSFTNCGGGYLSPSAKGSGSI